MSSVIRKKSLEEIVVDLIKVAREHKKENPELVDELLELYYKTKSNTITPKETLDKLTSWLKKVLVG